MKISMDAGAVCVNDQFHFGNYTFTQNLIEALQKYDPENYYTAYSFCKKPDWLKTADNFRYKVLKPTALWLSSRVSLEEMSHKQDYFLALNQAIPFSTRGKIISFSHGLSFYFFPQYYPDSYYSLKDQLDPMIRKSAYIVVPSRKVYTELEKMYPGYKNFKIMNYGVPTDMLSYTPVKRSRFFLFVGMNNKIKNIEFLVNSFRKFKSGREFREYKLFLIGNLETYEDEEAGIFVFTKADRSEIKKLYAEATGYLTSSYYESFNFPVLEALSQDCPVIGLDSAVIPEFRDFSHLAHNYSDFINQMISVARNTSIKSYRKVILHKFSWKRYISKLSELYL